ncbi:MAG TPA: hypothetical protein VNG90_05410 [Candidatus Acidoferrum sp.]|nr:hypothetical protein [Candidatus Acidoferrum sp.]
MNDLDFLIPVVCLYPSFEVLGIWLFNNFVAACVELAISLAIFAFGVTAEAQEIRPGEESCLPQLILIVILGWGGVPFLALMLGNLPVLIWILRVPALAVVGYIVVQLSQAIFDEIRK